MGVEIKSVCSRCGRELDRYYKGQVFCCSLKPETEDLRTKTKWPFFIRGIAKLKKSSDIGLGDTVERIFFVFGGTQFKWLMGRLGVTCGCEDRKQYLNRVFPYAPKLHHEETN